MSRGLGWLEREILSAVVEEEETYTRPHLAYRLFSTGQDYDRLPTPSELSSMNRAVRSLIRKGLLAENAYPGFLFVTEEGRRSNEST